MTEKEFYKLLVSNGSVLIGSRRLKVENKDSDVDIAISQENFQKIKKENLISLEKYDIINYFNYLPLGNNTLLRTNNPIEKQKFDILIFENQEEVDFLEEVMKAMSKIPKIILEKKFLRITMTEILLSQSSVFEIEFKKNKKP